MRALNGAIRNRYRGIEFRVVDWITFSFCAAFAVLVTVFAGTVQGWYGYVALHAVYLFAALEFMRASHRNPDSRVWGTLRVIYPAFLCMYGFFAVSRVQNVFFGEPWATDLMLEADLALFGVHPTVWIKQFYVAWFDEIMGLFRLLYFVVPVLILGRLVYQDRREEILVGGGVVVATYVVNYLFFFVLPAINPSQVPEVAALYEGEYTGYFFAVIEKSFQGNEGAVTGATFPSAHVSATVAWAWVTYRAFGRIPGHLVSIVCIGTGLATVYVGYHHAVDPIGGFVLGFVVPPLVLRWMQRRGEPTPAPGLARSVPAPVGAPARLAAD